MRRQKKRKGEIRFKDKEDTLKRNIKGTDRRSMERRSRKDRKEDKFIIQIVI